MTSSFQLIRSQAALRPPRFLESAERVRRVWLRSNSIRDERQPGRFSVAAPSPEQLLVVLSLRDVSGTSPGGRPFGQLLWMPTVLHVLTAARWSDSVYLIFRFRFRETACGAIQQTVDSLCKKQRPQMRQGVRSRGWSCHQFTVR